MFPSCHLRVGGVVFELVIPGGTALHDPCMGWCMLCGRCSAWVHLVITTHACSMGIFSDVLIMWGPPHVATWAGSCVGTLPPLRPLSPMPPALPSASLLRVDMCSCLGRRVWVTHTHRGCYCSNLHPVCVSSSLVCGLPGLRPSRLWRQSSTTPSSSPCPPPCPSTSLSKHQSSSTSLTATPPTSTTRSPHY